MQNRGDDFGEKLERGVKPVAQTVNKVIGDVIKDVKESLGLENLTQLPPQQQQKVQNDDQNKMAAIRQNLQKIDQEFMQAYKKRTQIEKQEEQKKDQQKQVKKEEKKKKEAAWKREVKANQGSKETNQRASG